MSFSRSLPNGSLLNSYKIIDVLGAGGFGVTYKAFDRTNAGFVAIKEYFPARLAKRLGGTDVVPSSQETLADFQWGLERFENEGQALALFRHPHIIEVVRLFRANNTGYMVLKLETGQDLKHWKKSLKRMPSQAQLDQLIEPLLDALETIHSNGLLHRDIAPDNIVMRHDGYPVLLDFGAARDAVETRGAGQSAIVKGGFSPPEQYFLDPKQNRQGPWTDIYSMAATFYFLITGKVPPQGNTRLAHDTLVPVSQIAAGRYRPAFLAAIDDAMQIQPADRPRSVHAWRAMILDGRPSRKTESVLQRIKPGVTKALTAAKEKLPRRLFDPVRVLKRGVRTFAKKTDDMPRNAQPSANAPQFTRNSVLPVIVASAVVVVGIVAAISLATQFLN